MSNVAEQVKEIAIKHGKQAAIELIEVCLFPALEEAAKNSATPIDDVLVAALKQPLKDQLLKLING